MKKVIALMFVFTILAVVATTIPIKASSAGCTEVKSTGGIPDLSSADFTFDCTSTETVYFGACDSGNVPRDDYFQVVFQGKLVSRNRFAGNQEFVGIGQAQAPVGSNVATLVSVSTTQFPPATYSLAVSTDRQAVIDYLVQPQYCGADVTATSFEDVANGCERAVPLFTTDAAPANGTLEMRVQFGEQNRTEGYNVRTWQVIKGKQINNESGIVPAPKWVRVWWQPAGESDWYLLPSQYWAGSGTTASEYGVSCDNKGVPSYHTSFANAIHQSEVPLLNP